MISKKYKFIFSHIPKCGGTSILDFFYIKDKTHSIRKYDKLGEHKTFKEYQKKFSSKFKSYFKFCFVRNPFDRCVSLYYFRKKRANELSKLNEILPAHWPNINEINKYSFKDMVKKSLEDNNPNTQYLEVGCRDDWWLSDEIVQKVNFIGRFENLQEDFDIICDKIGIARQQLPHKNATKHKHYTEYYDEETKSIVAKKYRKDIEYFGYEFGE